MSSMRVVAIGLALVFPTLAFSADWPQWGGTQDRKAT
jgi:hypothetical protein